MCSVIRFLVRRALAVFRLLGSRNSIKSKRKVARYQRYGAHVRLDVAHQTSHTLAVEPRYKLFVFEAPKIKNMTSKAKAKQDEQGRWVRNGEVAKSGSTKPYWHPRSEPRIGSSSKSLAH